MLGVEFLRFVAMLLLANAFLRLLLSMLVRQFPGSDIPNALAFAV